MAVTQVRTCDICKTNEDVNILTGVYGKKAFEVDLCETCWGKVANNFAGAARRPTRATIKPQHRFHKTEISKASL
jgi:hypothetical protein